MESFKIKNLNFTYPKRQFKSLDNISLDIAKGEFVCICGKSGCGKTTLLRLLKPVLSPHGEMEGEIFFNGNNIYSHDYPEQIGEIGFVLQNPDAQIVTDKVWHELAFGLESMGQNDDDIRTKVAEMALFFGIEDIFHKKTCDLSGGQKQLLALASVMVMQPKCLILDEPTSQLDPISAREFLKTLERINHEFGTTIIVSEHRLEDTLPLSHRVIVMEKGKIIASGAPTEVAKILGYTKNVMFEAMPTPMRIHALTKSSLPCPVNVRDGRLWLQKYLHNHKPTKLQPKFNNNTSSETALCVKDVYFRYEINDRDVLKRTCFKVEKGEFATILGGNGSGKTTLLKIICGIEKPHTGKVKTMGSVGIIPQNPELLFCKDRLYDDLADAAKETYHSDEQLKNAIISSAKLCQIENLLSFHPYDLSGGEKQRAALAKVILQNPDIILMDEPTKGMDAVFKNEFAKILDMIKRRGVTVVAVSHDIEFCAMYADKCALLFDGEITSQSEPRRFFDGKNFYTTAAAKMTRDIIPDAIIADDILNALGIAPPEHTQKNDDNNSNEPTNASTSPKKTHMHKTAVISLIIMMITIPITLYLGVYHFGDRKYYFVSMLIILQTITAFLLSFEKRKPKPREIVVISVLCAIGVGGRMAFFMVPQFKPVMALVIISAACLGEESGFLVGVITAFLSNFFFGQGPWTPWQMFAFGVAGFTAGITFKLIPQKKHILAIFGAISCIVIYGGIMNPASVIMHQHIPNVQMIVLSYVMGLPVDAVHALSTAVFLWFLSEPMIRKLERIKIKYGLNE